MDGDHPMVGAVPEGASPQSQLPLQQTRSASGSATTTRPAYDGAEAGSVGEGTGSGQAATAATRGVSSKPVSHDEQLLQV